MPITLNPNQEQAIQDAIRAGQLTPVDELIDRVIAGLPSKREAEAPTRGLTVFEQGLGLFSSPEAAALLDEVVSIAYAERRHPKQAGT
jgi:hypothetical protein